MILLQYGEGQPWYPESERHDWRAEWLGVAALKDISERPPLLLVDSSDGYQQEVTEANTQVYLNTLFDPMDMITILDERDDTNWNMFRGLHSAYLEVVEMIVPYATIVQTYFPLASVERAFYRRQAESDSVNDALVKDISRDLDLELHELFENQNDE